MGSGGSRAFVPAARKAAVAAQDAGSVRNRLAEAMEAADAEALRRFRPLRVVKESRPMVHESDNIPDGATYDPVTSSISPEVLQEIIRRGPVAKTVPMPSASTSRSPAAGRDGKKSARPLPRDRSRRMAEPLFVQPEKGALTEEQAQMLLAAPGEVVLSSDDIARMAAQHAVAKEDVEALVKYCRVAHVRRRKDDSIGTWNAPALV